MSHTSKPAGVPCAHPLTHPDPASTTVRMELRSRQPVALPVGIPIAGTYLSLTSASGNRSLKCNMLGQEIAAFSPLNSESAPSEKGAASVASVL